MNQSNFDLGKFKSKQYLSKKDENELFEQIKEKNEDVRQFLIERNIGLIHTIASKIASTKDEQNDFIQQGILALEDAIDHFDYQRNVKFSTYGYHYVENGIKKYILTQTKYKKITKKEKRNLEHWISAKNYFMNLGISSPSEAELVEHLSQYGLNLRDVRQIEYLYYTSFTSEVPVDDFETMHSLDSTDGFLKDELSNQVNNEILSQAISRLTERERDVINKKFGLNGEKIHTLQEIADIYGFSRERIRQLKASALFKIERYIVNKF